MAKGCLTHIPPSGIEYTCEHVMRGTKNSHQYHWNPHHPLHGPPFPLILPPHQTVACALRLRSTAPKAVDIVNLLL